MVCRISSAKPSPARWLSPGSCVQLRVGQPVDDMLPMGERDDVVAVAVPPADRDLHLLEPESPVPGEDDDIGERSRQLLAAAVEQVVEEHRLEFRPHQQTPIAFGGYPRVEVQRGLSDRLQKADETDRRPSDRESGHGQQRGDQ